MSIRKPYDHELFLANDPKGRKAGIQVLKDLFNKDAVDGRDQYGIDLYVPKTKEFFEIEVRGEDKWAVSNGKFKYDPIHLPDRKGKYLFEGYYGYIIFRPDVGLGALLTSDNVAKALNARKREVPNEYVQRGELFYSWPYCDWLWFTLDNNKYRMCEYHEW